MTTADQTQQQRLDSENTAAYVQVAVPVPMRRVFDYLPVRKAELAIGARVKVPFGHRRVIGYVVGHSTTTQVSAEQLKAITAVTDAQPLWPDSLWRLLLWSATYYQHPLGEVLAHAAPIALRQGQAPAYQQTKQLELTPAGEICDLTELKGAPQQQRLLARVKREPLAVSALAAEDLRPAAVKALKDKGLIRETQVMPEFAAWTASLAEEPHQLNPQQAVAVAAINTGLAEQNAQTWLVEGVTGSGKTEVYLQIMHKVLLRGQQVLVMVPEIGLTPQTVQRFRNRFDVPVIVLHSGLSDNERLLGWLQARDGHAAIVLGTRSAIFTPLANPGLIIIDEEHDASFKQQDGFRYNARDLAIKRAHLENFAVVLGSATPSLESLANVRAGRYQLVQLANRAGQGQPVKNLLVDLKQQRLQQGLSETLIALMTKHLSAGNQVLLFLNRRGYASALICHECGWVSECQRCHANMTVHQQTHTLQCHHCGAQRRLPRQCGGCGSTQLITRGLGTEQLEETMQHLFPDYKAIRIDRDSTRRKGQLEDYLTAVNRGEYQILLGTQMLAKGHHFPEVTLVALLDVDGALYSSDFRAPERLAQLYIQVAGRAGRAAKKGTVVLQTHHPEHPLIQELINNGYQNFALSALEERAQAMLPPYAAMALLRAEADDAVAAEALLMAMADRLQQQTDVAVIGPMPAILARRAGRYRFQLLLHATERKALHRVLHQFLPQFETLPEGRKARWSLDIDPQDFS
ncbi:MAG: primosomal protein N' [Aliidiomarina sp.]|uniref:primosomal protein N' n=1 Tax=Aliidiomarina sp. TaxID=1872439 RepID=UPI0025C33BED|nr:primosomal protein N' [Aliidiomarina sp.]MCH8500684.1 primosomal protein N' [Aliidiomarina sp.]